MRKALAALVALAVAAVIAAGAVVLAYRSAERGTPGGRDVTVVIPPGFSGPEIAQTLEERKVVGSAFFFRMFLKRQGGGRDLKAGEYGLREGMAFEEVQAVLEKGPEVEFVRMTIPEGLTVAQAAARVGQQTHVTAEQFLEAAVPATVRPAILPPDAGSLEGFLYPQTYQVVEREAAADLVRRMVAQFEKETADAPWEQAQVLGVTPYQVLVIASLIEEEAKTEEDRSLISAVIHNRLRRGMRLEIDATVQYAVSKYEGQPLTQSDLAHDSPYNTRLHPGLPPTPIASPRAGSVVAALRPADSDALYFVLSPDCRRHLFTADYDEFLRGKAEQCRRT